MFPPQWAPRMGYLCKYIKDFDWQPYVLSAGVNVSDYDKDFSFLAQCADVEKISVSETEQQKYLTDQNYSLAKKIKAFFLPDYNRPPGVNEKMFDSGIEILQKHDIDLILCSTCNITPLGAAKRLADKFNIPWVADLRDIVEEHGKLDLPLRDRLAIHRIILRRNYLLRKAAAVISVSPWHADFLKRINSNAHSIYNGFDPEFFKFGEKRIMPKFTICYAGTLPGILTELQANRALSLLFNALTRLTSDKIINPSRFQLSIYSSTEAHKYVMTQAKDYNIEYLVDCKSYVRGDEIPEIFNQSSILLMLADKSTPTGPKGICTTKFFEYLGTGRPILLIRSDEAGLEKAVVESSAGMAARTVDDAYNFIKSKYLEWQTNGFTIGTTNQQIINKYSRKEQAKEFASILNRVIKR